MRRTYELENLRRSIAMLTPGAQALWREEALALLEDLAEVQCRLDALRGALRAVLDEPDR